MLIDGSIIADAFMVKISLQQPSRSERAQTTSSLLSAVKDPARLMPDAASFSCLPQVGDHKWNLSNTQI
jgi:hypothetical protein